MEFAYEFTPRVAASLIVYSLGSLIYLFLMVLILGQRRLRRLEWLLFWLISALFLWNSGNLLALNVSLHYGVGPNGLTFLSRLFPLAGLLAAAPLAVHAHAAYAARQGHRTRTGSVAVVLFYLPIAAAPWVLARVLGHLESDALLSMRPFVRPIAVWMAAALIYCVFMNTRLAQSAAEPRLSNFHGALAADLGLLAVGIAARYAILPPPVLGFHGYFAAALMSLVVLPGALVGYSIFRQNLLDLRVQRNLVYTLFAAFALLIYLDVVRRVSGFLEWKGILPAVVVESLMIFVLVVLIEPLKKFADRLLRAAFASEFEKVQKLSAEAQECAKEFADVGQLKRLVAERLPAALRLERAELHLGGSGISTRDPAAPRKTQFFPIRRGEDVLGVLEVVPLTADMSGDQFAALQLLADQLGAAVELCQLIADKLQLERQLAAKARMAFLGEMAARIAHNVKNPLSSMKTIVQLLEEDSSLPERARQDCRLVTSEIDRLNQNIGQVLRYAKPARDTDRPADLGETIQRILTLTRPEAERREVKLEFSPLKEPCAVAGGEEAASDILSNLVVNALEASPPGSTVRIRVANGAGTGTPVELSVEDEGPGIPAEEREKIFQPFFTTRPGGTGLGLAIVARRAEEIGGSVDYTSPLGPQGGTRFRVRFRPSS